MIISPSHTLEYKPNDIIITSSIGYVLLHHPNIIETIILQVNEKFFELKKGHIGIVEKAQETSSDSDMHNTVCLCHCSTS